jgi:hypothetical protein
MAQGDMVYNTEKGNLEIPEYGRNVQNIVLHLKKIDDKQLRQAYAEQVINLFAIMYPANRHLADYKEKLWNHLFRIAEYNLDVDIPQGITIHRKDVQNAEAHLPYPQKQFNNRHYGRYTQEMIKNALAIEDQEKKDAYKEVIASYMKLAYRTWNKEHFVSDDIILQDLKEISHGKLTFDDDYSIENLISMKNKLGSQPSNNNWKKFGKGNNNRGNGKSNNSNGNRKRQSGNNMKFKKR